LNYSGKFSANTPLNDTGAPLHGHFHVDSVSTHAPSGAILVSDADLLFNGDFKRSGVDLILSRDHQELVLQDYFKGEKRAALSSPDGAHLTGDIINALTGYQQFAQAAGSASVAKVIGHVSKLTGTATAIRNGVSIILNNGDNVEKGDVVQAGSNSTLGLTFIDGTVFGLSSNARMVLNEMVYDPNGSNNSALLSLVAGTISFVAGETAKHGDMKVDTPVATMGIRGTAVLVEIDFDVPAQGGAPAAKFQVLVEPDGTTGKYVLLDKLTQLPIATVDQAGVVKSISNGILDSYNSPLTPDAQKLITDLFALKFTNVQDPNPKTTVTQNDTITPESLRPFIVKVAAFDPAPPPPVPGKTAPDSGTGASDTGHVAGPPTVVVFGSAVGERAHLTGSSVIDTTHGTILFADLNVGDRPTATTTFDSFSYQNAQHNDVTASLTAEQLAAIKAVEVPLVVVPDPGNTNTGSVTWTYNVADGAFDFLADGETLTLAYTVEVDNNFGPSNEKALKTFTITVTGTNDAPTIATAGSAITERIGTGNNVTDTASGTVTFTDVDLTDRPVVSATFASFRYIDSHGHDITATLTAAQLAAVMAVEVPPSVAQAAGNTHNGSATWTYSLTDKAFDFLAQGETLILNYVAQVDDGHGGVVSTPISVSINGADVTIGGTNDVPTIVPGATTATGAVTEDAAALLTAGGTITYQDVDLTDTHTAAFVLKSSDASANLPGYSESAPLGQIGTFALGPVNENDADSINIGSVGWTFTLPDNDPVLQSLAQGQTITQIYTVTITDNNGASVTQDVTVTITGTNDAPTIVAESSTASGGVTEDVNVSDGDVSTAGTMAFQDLDLIDTHTATAVFTSSASSVHLPGFAEGTGHIGQFVIDPSVTENPADTNNGATLGWTFTLDDSDPVLQSLAQGQTITQVYAVTVADGHGGIVTQDITVVITGTNDAPVVAADASGPHPIAERAYTTGDSSDLDTTSGTLAFTDVDLIDTHTVSKGKPGFVWSDSYGHTFDLTLAQQYALTTASTLDLTLHDSTVTGVGSVGFNYRAADSSFDFLAAGEILTVTYNVTVTDEHHGASTRPVTVTVTGSNDAPVITSGPQTAVIPEIAGARGSDEADRASGAVTFTDVDLNDSHAVTVTGVHASGTTSGLPGLDDTLRGWLTLGTLTDSGNGATGSEPWVFSAPDHYFDYLAAGQSVTLDYTVQVSDHHGGTALQHIDITITGTNDAPVVATDGSGPHVITERTGLTHSSMTDMASGTLAFTDVDLADTHLSQSAPTFSWTNSSGLTLSSSQQGTLTAASVLLLTLHDSTTAGAGSVDFNYSAADSNFDFLAAGETLTVTYGITVTDDNQAASTQPVTITVTGTNDAPVIASAPQTASITEIAGALGSYTVDSRSGAVTFTDVDLSDIHTVTMTGVHATGVTSGLPPLNTTVAGWLTLGPLTDSVNGATGSEAWTFSAQDHYFDYLAAGGTVTLDYAVQVADINGGTATQHVDVTIIGTEDAPVITGSPQTASINERAGLTNSAMADTAHGTVTFTDADRSDTHTVTVTGVTTSGEAAGLPANQETLQHWLTLAPLTDTVNGAPGSDVWTFSAPDKNFDYLRAGQTVTLTYTVEVADNHGGTTTQHIDVTITGTNDAPVIQSETNPPTQTVIVVNPVTPIVLAQGVNTNLLGLHTETFNDHQQGLASNNGADFGDFYSADLGATFDGSGHAGVVRGTSSVTAAPFIGPGVADTTNYLSIGAGGTETITFTHDQNAFGLYWGSVDSYNTIAFYHGTTLVASYNGGDISPLFPTGNQGSFSSNGYVEFAGLASFDKVVLGSGNSNAFEIDNISAGTVPVPHVELAAPMTGTMTVSDADVGDTLSASVVGNAVVHFHGSNGSPALPANANVAALISANAVTFDTAHSNGGTQVLHWTYDPANPNLDFLKAGDSLTLTFTAQVNDGHGNVGSQPLTITITGASPTADMSQFSVVNGTSQNDTFNHVGNNATIFGNGGRDSFVFNAHFGGATIGDFDFNNDTITVDKSLFATVQAFVDAAHPSASGHDTIITDAANDTITLAGVNAAALKAHLNAHPNDFHIV
jgi:VCBS repeat-containing protein